MFCSPGLRGSKRGLRGTVSVVNADTVTRAAARTSGSRCHHSGRSDGDHRDRGRGSHIASGNRDSRRRHSENGIRGNHGEDGKGSKRRRVIWCSQVRDTPTGS